MNDFYNIKDGKVYINIKVTTKASKNAITGVRSGELLISVAAAPENNKANAAVVNLISEKIDIPKSMIHIIFGEKGRNKKILVDSKKIESVLSRLDILKNQFLQ